MRDVLLHAHIFKNAGSTLDWSLHRSFGEHFLPHRADKPMRQQPAETLRSSLEEHSGLLCLSSHALPCPAPKIEGVRFHTLLLLRHPLKRARSVYAFERQQEASTPGAQAAKRLSFEEYLRWRMRDDVGPTLRNFQTRYLAGQAARQPGYVTTRQTFQAALDFLTREPYAGVVERYADSMVTFEEALGGRFPALDLAYRPQNMTRASLSDESLDWLDDLGALRDELIDKNSYDLALYQVAQSILDESIASVEGFERKLEAFRSRQAALTARKSNAQPC